MVRPAQAGQTIGLLLLALACGAAGDEPGPPPSEQEGETAAGEPAVRVGWDAGRTFLETSRFRLELSNRLQLRWDGVWPGESDRGATGSFRVRRAKSALTGWAYSERVRFEIEVNWARPARPLDDAFVDFDATGNGALRVTLGQYKVPFGRQELTSSGRQQFLSRSITSLLFAHGRDVGLMLHGEAAGGRLSWAAGMFNGSGPGRFLNEDGRYQFDARVQVAPNGDPGYSEADLRHSPRPLYGFAVQFEHDDEGLGEGRRRVTTWGADGILKYRGVFLFGELFGARLEPAGAASLDRSGFTLQAGYVFGRVGLAGRLARFELGTGDALRETGVALSWYQEGHRLKLESDLRFLDGTPAGADDTELRFQAQLVF